MKCTSSIGLIKRAVPFLATFTFALLITSFFVDIRPGFRRHRGEWRFQEMQRLRTENERLRIENEQLRASHGSGMAADSSPESDSWRMGPEFQAPLAPPPPPVAVAPHAHR